MSSTPAFETQNLGAHERWQKAQSKRKGSIATCHVRKKHDFVVRSNNLR